MEESDFQIPIFQADLCDFYLGFLCLCMGFLLVSGPLSQSYLSIANFINKVSADTRQLWTLDAYISAMDPFLAQNQK